MMRHILIIILAFIALSTTASATVRHVPSQYSTIQAGINASVNGDTVLVGPGTYSENILFGGKNIKLLGRGGADSTILQPASTSQPIVRFINGENTIAQISGFTIQNSGPNVAVSINNASPTVCHNVFFHNQFGYTNDPTPLRVFSGGPYIHHNLFNQNGGMANVYISSAARFENNTIVNSQRAGIIAYGGAAIIKNNIVVGCPYYGIIVDHSTAVDYNDFYGNNPNYINATPGPHGISVDPAFVNPAQGNFNLQPVSPCIDTGDPTSPLDLDGTQADMGAYFYDQIYMLGFQLVEPRGDSVLINSPGLFVWHATRDSRSVYSVFYRFFIDDDPLFASPDSSEELSDSTIVLGGNLERSRWYYWKVLAYNYHGDSIYNDEVWKFYIDNYPTLPEIIGPISGATVDLSAFLSWTVGTDSDTMDTVTYSLQIDNDPAFGSPEIDVDGITDQGTISDQAVAIRLADLPEHENLQGGQTYNWRVRSDDRFGLNSGFTDGTHFFTYDINMNNPPHPPMGEFSPANGEIIIDQTPAISWDAASDPDPDDVTGTLHYILHIDRDSLFNNPAEFQYVTPPGQSQITVVDSLANMTQWFYRIRTVDDGGLASAWSAVQDFNIMFARPPKIIRVPTEYPTIQAGIDAGFEGDTVLVSDGHYYERINFRGKGITVTSQHLLNGDTLHIANTIIDADTLVIGLADTGSVVRFVNGEDSTAVLHGLTIRGGGGSLGHGIFCYSSPALIEECVITQNDYFGLYVENSSGVVIRRCRIIDNGAGGARGGSLLEDCILSRNQGPGFYGKSGFALTGCLISENEGDGAHVVNGGGFFQGCTIEQNQEYGIETVTSGTIDVADCHLRGNGDGGVLIGYGEGYLRARDSEISGHDACGIMAWGDSAVIDRCTFVANRGGGLSGRTHVHINSCVFEDNSSVQGGAVYLCYPNAYQHTLRGCTFVGNSAAEGTAVYYFGNSLSSALSIENCLLAFNDGGPAVSCSTGTVPPVISCTNIFGNPGGDWAGCIADQTNINGNFSADPMFCDTANGDFFISSLSPCAPYNNACDSLIGAFGVGCSGLADFHLLSPAPDTVFTGPPCQLSWSHSIDPYYGYETQYTAYIDADPLFASPDTLTAGAATALTLPDTLGRSAAYYWKVKASNGHAPERFSAETFSFYVDGYPTAPGIFAPLNGANADSATLLSWLLGVDPDSFDVLTYSIQVDDDSTYASPEIGQSGLCSGGLALDDAFAIRLGELDNFDNLQLDTRYFWRVRSDDAYGLSSDWTDGPNWFVFLAQNHAPSPPLSGFSPAGGEEVASLRPVFRWNIAHDSDPDDYGDNLAYAFRLSLDSTFAGFVFFDTTAQGVNQIQLAVDLVDDAHYFFAVRTIDDGGLSSDWSPTQNFWTNQGDSPPEPFPLYGPIEGHRQVTSHTHFSWGSTVDHDPNSSYTFRLQFSPDSLFRDYVRTVPGLTDTAYSLPTDSIGPDCRVFWRVQAIDDDNLTRLGGIPEGSRLLVALPSGDANSNCVTNGLDVTYLVGYLKGANPAPNPILAGDANGNCTTNGIDVVYLVAYLKGIGAPPVRPDCGEVIAGEARPLNRGK